MNRTWVKITAIVLATLMALSGLTAMGRLCVIGSNLKEDALAELFGL